MKKLHKYTSGQGPFFVLSESNTRPFKGQSLTEVIWQGMAVPGNKDIVKMNDLSFSMEEEEVPEEKPAEEKPAEEKPAEKKEEKKAFVGELDAIADEIQGQDPVVAYLIDRVADQLEGK